MYSSIKSTKKKSLEKSCLLKTNVLGQRHTFLKDYAKHKEKTAIYKPGKENLREIISINIHNLCFQPSEQFVLGLMAA